MNSASRTQTRLPGSQLGHAGLLAVLTALVVLAARDAARVELRECRSLIGSIGCFMESAPKGVKAVAAALAAAAKGTSRDRTANQATVSPAPPLPLGGLCLEPSSQSSGREGPTTGAAKGADEFRACGGAPLRPALHDLPPPTA